MDLPAGWLVGTSIMYVMSFGGSFYRFPSWPEALMATTSHTSQATVYGMASVHAPPWVI